MSCLFNKEEFRKLDSTKTLQGKNIPHNLSYKEKEALKTLGNNKDLVIRAADKGGGVVVQNFGDYQREALHILSDPEYYERIQIDPFPDLNKRIYNLLMEGLSKQVISKDEFRFLNIQQPNIPGFYHLPKIHKDLTNPPGRPIVTGINSATSNLSQYLDELLQIYVKKQPTFLRDSDDLIRLIHNTQWTEGLSFLTMDVSSLYSNIDHDLGVGCVDRVLMDDPEIPEIQRKFITDSLHFILTNNYFKFGGDTFRQKRGTAMGTRVAPAFANIFMGAFEEVFITGDSEFHNQIVIYKRFIDYLFLIWKGTESSAMEFVNKINNNKWGVILTPNFNTTTIEFLDLNISQNNCSFQTSTHFKSVDTVI